MALPRVEIVYSVCIATFLTLSTARGSDDCNNNDIHDSVDIANGTSTDCNHNLIPDECDAPIPETINVVFIIDTSSSMYNELHEDSEDLGGKIADAKEALLDEGVPVDWDGDTAEVVPTDLAMQPRVGGTAVDMGALEYHQP